MLGVACAFIFQLRRLLVYFPIILEKLKTSSRRGDHTIIMSKINVVKKKLPKMPDDVREYFKKSGFSMISAFNDYEGCGENSLDFFVHISRESYDGFKEAFLEVYSMLVYEKDYPVVPTIITLNGANKTSFKGNKTPKVFCNLVVDPLDNGIVNMIRSLVHQKTMYIYYYDEYMKPIAKQEYETDDVLVEDTGMLYLLNNILEARMQGKLSKFANFNMAAEKFHHIKPKRD